MQSLFIPFELRLATQVTLLSQSLKYMYMKTHSIHAHTFERHQEL